MANRKSGSQSPLQCGLNTGAPTTSTLSDVMLCKVLTVSGNASARGTIMTGGILNDRVTVITSSYGSTVALNIGVSGDPTYFADCSGVTGTTFTNATVSAHWNNFGGSEVLVQVSGSASPTGKIMVFMPYVVVNN